MAWQAKKEWAIKQGKGRTVEADIYRMALAASMYDIWIDRNLRMFQKKKQNNGDYSDAHYPGGVLQRCLMC